MKKDIVIIGAWISGLGVGSLLGKYSKKDYLILESGKSVGTSFLNRTRQTEFISPSFVSIDFGIYDLN